MVVRLTTVLGDDARGPLWVEGRGPAPVAALRAKTADVGLDDGDAERRVAPQEFARGPQAGEASANDGDVDVTVALEGGP